MGKGILALLSALAEDDRVRINKRADEGRVIAKRNGVKFGRKPALTEHQQRVALEMLDDEKTVREVARTLGVGKSTISRLKKFA